MNEKITNQQNQPVANTHPLRAAFEKLPEPVKQWLTSEQVTSAVISINSKLDLVGDLVAIIPNYLILRLVVKDLNPENFIKELNNQLDLSPEQAKAITEEIYQKILKPIETPLGINLDKMLQYSDLVSPAGLQSPQIETLSPKPPTTSTPSPKPPTPSLPRNFQVPSVGSINVREELKQLEKQIETKKVNYSGPTTNI